MTDRPTGWNSTIPIGDKRLERHTPLRNRNPERKAKEFRRCYGSQERVEKIKALPCHNCGKRHAENAHTEGGGTGRKAGWRTVADLCSVCHRTGKDSLHNLGSVERFDAVHGTRLRERAQQLAREIPMEG